MGDFSDAALVLLGHGSTVNADSAAPTHQHAEELRQRGVFAQVVTGFWKEHPAFSGVLRGVYSPRVFVVPLFISEGYFTEEAPTPSECSLFIAGHGTSNNENSRRAIEDQVLLIRKRGLYRDVHPIFMEEDPRIADAYTLGETENLIVVPFFISDGLHSYEDIPVMLGASAEIVQERFRRGEPTWTNPTTLHGKRVWYGRSIGTAPMLADVVMDRVRESAATVS